MDFTELLLLTDPYHIVGFTGLTSDANGHTSVAGSDTYPDLYYCSEFPGSCSWFILGQHGGSTSDIFNAYGLATDPGGTHLYGVTADCGSYGRGTVWQSD